MVRFAFWAFRYVKDKKQKMKSRPFGYIVNNLTQDKFIRPNYKLNSLFLIAFHFCENRISTEGQRRRAKEKKKKKYMNISLFVFRFSFLEKRSTNYEQRFCALTYLRTKLSDMSTIHADGSYVKSTIENGVATIEFFHPKGNAMPGVLLSELASAITNASASTDTKVILLRSAGEKAFCAGASFDELAAVKNEEEGKIFFSGFANVINAMRKAPQLIVGLIHSKCVGGGVGIAAACDYAIASEKASVKLSELKVGIGPFVIGPAVERKIGTAAFSQMTLDAGNWYTAQWSLEKGLFAEVHTTDESLYEAVNKKTHELAASSLEAMKEIKKMLWQGTDEWSELLYDRAAISGRLVLTEASRTIIKGLIR